MPATSRAWLAALGGLAAAALALAYALEHLGGFLPCRLCLWQRYPYMAVVVVALAGIALGRPRPALLAGAALCLGAASIAGYHVGVEQGLIALPAGCAAGTTATTVEALRAQLLNAAPACDQVSVLFMGLSLSAWNALAATGMALVALAAWTAGRRTGS